jgi:signal transduction histidine kinase
VTTEAASRTPAGEAGFRLLAEHLPNLILLAFDSELLTGAATGAALRGECRRLDTSGKTDPSLLWSHTFVPLPVVLRVSDDGRGFDPEHVQVLADIAHFGLIAMRERVEALGGRFRVTTAPGQGTVVEAKLPLTVPTEGPGP